MAAGTCADAGSLPTRLRPCNTALTLTGGARADPRQWCLHATPAAGQVAERRGGRQAPGALASTAGSGFVPSSVDTDQPGARFRGRDLLRTVAEGTAGAVGDEFLRGLVRHVALAFDAKFAFVAEADDPTGQHVRVVSGWYAGGWMDEPFEYDTRGKPCAPSSSEPSSRSRRR